jgi:hypothetical protein
MNHRRGARAKARGVGCRANPAADISHTSAQDSCETHPDAVTFNEACSNDVAQIARRTAYHVCFSRVIYDLKPLACIHRAATGSSVTRCSPRQRSRAPRARLSRHEPAPSGAYGCASAPASVSTSTVARPAPPGIWTLTDMSAYQDPGIQHVYGSGGLSSPSAHVLRATHTDHDVLLVRAHLTAQH